MGSKNAVKVFHRTQVNVGGGLSVAVGPYPHSRGLFAGISLHGAVITPRTETNSNLYGQKLTPEEILEESIAQFEASDRSLPATATQGFCKSCRCDDFVPKAFSKKCKSCTHVHNPY
ncbi:unnamed protein product [Peronospora destructor]|nr:unnamed protein product [Peronospora destructor]